MRVTIADIFAARDRISEHVRRTPLERSAWLSDIAGTEVFLKLECWQPTRSFKIRGAFNAIASLDDDARARGLVTASAGNHGQAVALAARTLGARATIFLPENAPEVKVGRVRSLGATVDQTQPNYDATYDAARAFADAQGATFVHAFAHETVVAGQGTVGLEILEDLEHIENVIVPVGGGGLAAGVGVAMSALSPATRVIGVQSDATRAMYNAYEAGHIVDTDIPPTLADGLAGMTEDASYQLMRTVVPELRLVPESTLAKAIRTLFIKEGIVAEGAGAVGIAAIAERIIVPAGPTVIVVSGGNIDAGRLASILSAS